MADAPFLGMRATNDFTVDGQRPKNWREMILKLYPNGKAPLTAVLALAKSEATDDPEFNWFTKTLPTQHVDTTGMFLNDTLTTPVAAATAVGATLYVKMAEADAKNFVMNQVVLLRGNDPTLDTTTLVTDRKLAGANSYLRVQALMAQSAVLSTANVKYAFVVGSAYPEGAPMGEALQYDPTKWRNYTQIFRNALEITRTAKKTRLRTGPAYENAKKDALEMHSVEMEKAFIFGTPLETTTSSNGKPLRTTAGLVHAVKTGGGIVNTFAGAWGTAGQDWLDEQLMYIFRYGEQDKLGFIGDSALMGINKLARQNGQWTYTATTKQYGIQIVELVTPFGSLTLKTHPLFSHVPTNRNSLLIFEPKNIRYRYVTDTTFYDDDMKQGKNRVDGQEEEFLTEAGLEFHNPAGWGWLNGVGI